MAKTRNQEVIERFGQQVRQVRLEQGLTMEEVCYAADISYSQLARIELGEINTTVSTIFALAKGMGVEAYRLMQIEK